MTPSKSNSSPKRPRRPRGKNSGAAYAEAERRLSAAVAMGQVELDLSIHGLTTLPSLNELPALQSLDLSLTRVSDLAPLAGLTALQSLNLHNTQVSDLAPLAGLTALQSLNLHNTQVSDLTPLAGLTALQTLNFMDTRVSDLAPLAHLAALQSLNFSGTRVSSLARLADLNALQSLLFSRTQVADLAPIANLTALQSLYFRQTHVSDLAPLAGHSALQSLYLSYTRVSDLTPLSGLTGLQSLDLMETQVSDIAPLAGLTALIDGAKQDPHAEGGLSFEYCLLSDTLLVEFAKLDNPERTIRAINHLREQRGLPHYYPDEQTPADDPGEDKPKSRSHREPPPKLPSQGAGPHYAVSREGVIDKAPPAPLDRKGNNVPRLRSLHGPLRDAARDLVDRLKPNENSYPVLYEVARKYLEQIARATDELDFAALYGIGLRLDAAFASAKRDIDNANAPPFDHDQSEVLQTVRMMHGPLILASAEGQELIADAERYHVAEHEEQVLREEATNLGNAMKPRPDVATAVVADDIVETAAIIGTDPHKERSSNLTLHQVANFAITAGEVSIATLLGLHLGAEGVVVLGGAWAYVRNQPEGKEALQTAQGIYTRVHHACVDQLGSAVPRFMLDNEDTWRRLAAVSPRLAFIGKLIDWIKEEERKAS